MNSSETPQENSIENQTIEITPIIETTIHLPERSTGWNWSIRKIIVGVSIFVFVTVSSIALYKSKPTESQFELWVKKEAAEKRKKSHNVINKGVSVATQIQILATYRYSDHKLFVTVKASANGKKLQFLGIANHWFLMP